MPPLSKRRLCRRTPKIDTPFHRYDGGDLAALPLESVAFLPGVVITLPHVDVDVRGKAVLIHTGWSRHWRTDAYGRSDHPYLTREAAQHLADGGAALVGIDSVNIDDMNDPSRPAHTILLRHRIPVVEHLTNLDALGARPFTFFAVPPRFRGVGTFPVRAFAAV